MRSPFIFLGLALLLTGLSILMTIHGTSNFPTEYAALCLAAMGSFGIGGNIVCWFVMNLKGHAERSIGSAWMICFGNVGGIVATFAFVQKDSPYYHTGYSICLSMGALCVVSSACYALLIRQEMKAVAPDDRRIPVTQHTLYL